MKAAVLMVTCYASRGRGEHIDPIAKGAVLWTKDVLNRDGVYDAGRIVIKDAIHRGNGVVADQAVVYTVDQ